MNEVCGFVREVSTEVAIIIYGILGLFVLGTWLWDNWVGPMPEARRRDYDRATAGMAGTTIHTGSRREGDVIQLSGSLCSATVRFYHHDFGARRQPYTEFLASIEWSSGALKVCSPEWQRHGNLLYGDRDLSVGFPHFDRDYIVQARPESVASLLSRIAARMSVRRLQACSDGSFLLAVMPRGRLLVRVGGWIEDKRGLREFIRHCYEFVSCLMEATDAGVLTSGGQAAPAGITYLATPHATSEGPCECQVCGTQIDPPKRVLCRKCRTPSHKDCWDYNDGCSVFACGERGSVRG